MLSQHKILVSADALYELIQAVRGNGVELREMIATMKTPILPSLGGEPNPIKVLSDTLEEFCEKKGHYKPFEMFFVLESNNDLALSSGGLTEFDAASTYRKIKSVDNEAVDEEAELISATILLNDAKKVNINSLPTVEYTDKEYVTAVMKLASESTFYKNSDEQMFRIDACDEDKGRIHVINENSELAFVGTTIFAELVKPTDTFYKTYPTVVSNAVRSYVVDKQEEAQESPTTAKE